MIHVAILHRTHLQRLLAGEKSIESRLAKTAREPWERVEPGERIFFKQSGGPFRATALADHILYVSDLTPARVADLRREYNHAIGGDDDYWRAKKHSRYATLIWLRDVEPIDRGPTLRPNAWRAWFCLDDAHDLIPPSRPAPARNGSLRLTLTEGNLRHSHLYVRGDNLAWFPPDALGGSRKNNAGKPLTLHLAGGPVIETDIVESRGLFRIRRGWRSWFESHGARPGDSVVITPRSRYEYDLRLERSR